MKVSELIAQLEQYSPDEEILAQYWDKETAEANAGTKMTDDQWYEVVLTMEDYEPTHGTSYYLSEKVRKEVEDEVGNRHVYAGDGRS